MAKHDHSRFAGAKHDHWKFARFQADPYSWTHPLASFVPMKPLWSPQRRPPYGNIRPGSATPMLTMPGTTKGPDQARELAQRARAVRWARRVLANPEQCTGPKPRYKQLSRLRNPRP